MIPIISSSLRIRHPNGKELGGPGPVRLHDVFADWRLLSAPEHLVNGRVFVVLQSLELLVGRGFRPKFKHSVKLCFNLLQRHFLSHCHTHVTLSHTCHDVTPHSTHSHAKHSHSSRFPATQLPTRTWNTSQSPGSESICA